MCCQILQSVPPKYIQPTKNLISIVNTQKEKDGIIAVAINSNNEKYIMLELAKRLIKRANKLIGAKHTVDIPNTKVTEPQQYSKDKKRKK